MKTSKTSSGSALLELLVVLSLFGLFGLGVFLKQIQSRQLIEEIAVAENIKTIQIAMNRYVRNNWSILINGGFINGVDVQEIPNEGDVLPLPITDPGLADYLPVGFTAESHFNQAYQILIKRRPPGTSKPPVQVVVVSDNKNRRGAPFDDVAGARIAAMVGAGGGFLRSDETGGKVRGGMGAWEFDLNDYFTAASLSLPEGVHILSTQDFFSTEEESPLWGKVLFRESLADFPEGNMMLTDIDMTGNGLIDLQALRYTWIPGMYDEGIES
jgi:type II secretory pathway pseudopilin PulG